MNEKRPFLSRINKILFFLLAFILVIIVFGSAVVLCGGKRAVLWRHTQSLPDSKSIQAQNISVLGTLRLFCRDSGVILSVWFTPDTDDVAFKEEIETKERKIKALIANFFSLYTQQELLSMGEVQLKAQLQDLINAQLVLGKINAIYFDQYVFVS